jgi:predicted HTH transcriptional regulator
VKDKSVLASKIIIEVLKESNKVTGQLISYSDDERRLLTYIEEHGRITLKEFSKLTRYSNKKAQKIIVRLILANILIPNTSEKEEYFTAVN